MAARQDERDEALVRVCDLAGRPRGTGFLADAEGTMVTSHEAVDGLARLVLHAPGGQVCLVESEAITVLPEHGLALVATEGLTLPPLPIAPGGPAHPERRIRVRLPQRTEGTVVGTAAVTYTATDRFHLIDEVYELALDGADLSRVPQQASGAPLVDAATGAVLAVIATALQSGHRAGGFALPLRPAAAPPPLAGLLLRNAAAVPAYGPHLNLAGALRLTAVSVGSAAGPGQWREPVARPEPAAEFGRFLSGHGEHAPLVLGLVGEPGTGRSTELARLAARRARGPRPEPTVWLRGAELRPGDGGIRDAVERALRTAARTVCAVSGRGGASGEPPYASPEAVAGLARAAGRPLLVLLDAPEEMPPVLAHALADWTAGTAHWLRAAGVRLVVAGRPEFWAQAGALLPADLLHTPEEPRGAPPRTLPPCVRLGGLDPAQAAAARDRHGLPRSALAPADAAHPLALRLLSEIRAALPEEARGEGGPSRAPSRAEIFSAHLDLTCLRVAERLAARTEPPVRGTGVRRLAARVAGQVHEAARRCLGPGQGELDREAFEELFPWRTGWASAVLAEGLLVPAGAGYRFAHEEAADWLQSLHLDLDEALRALVHRWFAAPGSPAEAPVRLPSRPASRAGHPPPVPPAPPVAAQSFPRSLPVPRHRAGPVLQALLSAPPAVLARRLGALTEVLDRTPPPKGRAPAPPPGADRDADLDADTVPNPRRPRGSTASGTGGRAHPASVRPAPGAAPAPGGPPGVRVRVPPPLPVPPGADVPRAPYGPAAGVPPLPGVPRASYAPRVAEVPPQRSAHIPGTPDGPGTPAPAPGLAERRGDAVWWAAHLLGEVLLRVEDARPYREILRGLAGRIAVRAVERGGFTPEGMGGLGGFGPWFWRRLALPAPERLELLRVLLPADGPPGRGPRQERFLDAVADLLCAGPGEALPVVCGWFGDDRPLRTGPGADGPRLTVASAAQALLHTHRRLAVDDLTEALVAAAHPGADEVLAALAEDEPAAVCRAVDRWAHDPRPDRHVAAASYGRRAAPFARSAADRELLRHAALAILARPDDCSLHGAALGLLVRDPVTREQHLPAAVAHFAAGDPHLPAADLSAALSTHPEQVLAAFRTRLCEPGAAAGEVLDELAGITRSAPARRAAVLVAEHLRLRPDGAADVARYLERRLEQGPAARPVLLPLLTALLREHPPGVRRVLAPVLAVPGTSLSRPLRQELLDLLLETERDPAVLEALLTAAAGACHHRHQLLTRDLVHRVGLLLCRTPQGAARFDGRIVELALARRDFGALLREWLAGGGGWDAVIGPSARRRLDTVA